MDRASAALLVVAAGAMAGAQAPVNGALAKIVGTWQAALVSFAIGLVLVTVVVAVAAGGFGSLGGMPDVPWWALLGGVFGVAIVTTSIVAVGPLGAAGVTAAVVAGQVTASVIIDRFALFGVREQPITPSKLAGILLLAAGVYLVVRD